MPTSRVTARLIVIDAHGRVVLFRFRDRGDHIWITPGGGTRPGETLAAAAVRELREETGLLVTETDLGLPVATTSGQWTFEGQEFLGTDWFFAIRVPNDDIDLDGLEELERSLLVDYRWWTVAELADTGETVYPLGLAGLLRRLLAGERPTGPVALPWR